MFIRKSFITDDKNSILHSSGYARLANSGRIGSVSPNQQFGRRLEIDSNRQIIGRYRQSAIGGTYNIQRSQRSDFRSEPGSESDVRGGSGPARSGERPMITPPPRKYDPFA